MGEQKKELYQHWIFVRKKNFLNLLFWVRNSMNFKSVFLLLSFLYMQFLCQGDRRNECRGSLIIHLKRSFKIELVGNGKLHFSTQFMHSNRSKNPV